MPQYLLSYSFDVLISDELIKKPIKVKIWNAFIVEGNENTLVTFLKSIIRAGYNDVKIYPRESTIN